MGRAKMVLLMSSMPMLLELAGVLSRRKFASQAEAKISCFSYVEGFYNPMRLHSAIGYQSPICYEQQTSDEMAMTP